MRNPSTYDCKCNRTSKIDEYLYLENCLCRERLISKLVLEGQNEILNTTETSPDDKKVICNKMIFLFTRFHL